MILFRRSLDLNVKRKIWKRMSQMPDSSQLNKLNRDIVIKIKKGKDWRIKLSDDIEERPWETALNIFIQLVRLHKKNKGHQDISK